MRRILFTLLLPALILTACDRADDEAPTPTPSSNANWADSLQLDLWAHFTFDSANLNDGSGHNRNLRGVNNIALGADRNGVAGKALAFDGVNDYAVLDSGIYFPAGNFALSFAVFTNNTQLGRIFNKANFNTALGASLTLGFEPSFQNNLVFGVTKDPTICSSYSDINNTNVIPSFRPFTTGRWYNVVVQFDNGVQSMYVDGRLVSAMYTPNLNFGVCASAPMYFGMWWPQDPRAFNGRLDNIRIYDRALREDEIRYLNLNNL